jgi:hypothetical protein
VDGDRAGLIQASAPYVPGYKSLFSFKENKGEPSGTSHQGRIDLIFALLIDLLSFDINA